METQYKLICWNDYAIPVKNIYNWIAWDQNGSCYLYVYKPKNTIPIKNDGQRWVTTLHSWAPANKERHMVRIITSTSLTPPEPGDWKEQLYYIG